MPASALTLFLRNAVFLYLSFIASGLTSLVPQRFFARAVPEGKQAWLAGTLLLGTLGSMLGVTLARRFGWRHPTVGTAVLGAITLLLWVSFRVEALLLYVALQVVVRTVVNYAVQELDRRAVLLASEADRAPNDRIGTGLRFLGMLLGPLWFGFFPEGSWRLGALLVLLTGASVLSGRQLTGAPPPAPVAQARIEPLRGRERRLAVAGMAIYGAYYLLSSNLFYALSDLHHLAQPTLYAGGLITTVFATAVVMTIVSAPLAKGGLGLRWMLPAPLCLAGVALTLAQPLAAWPPIAFTAAVVLGSAFALFLLAVRNFATHAAQAGSPEWIAVYNNLGNTSALVGFVTMSALVGLAHVLALSYGQLLGPGLLLLSAVGGIAAMAASAAAPPAREISSDAG